MFAKGDGVTRIRNGRTSREVDEGTGPGSEIIAAGDLLVWFCQVLSVYPLQVEANKHQGLPTTTSTRTRRGSRARSRMPGRIRPSRT